MKNLFKALSNFQSECPVIHQDTKGFNYTYADLSKIHSIINPILRKHGLCITQPLENEGIRTILYHLESGESLESYITIPRVELKGQNDYQSYGSGITYFKRYSISAMLSIITDKDLDACGVQEEPKSLQMWKQEIDKCKSIEELLYFYGEHESIIEKNEKIMQFLSNRKNQLNNK
jgi:hypothetical protein